MSAGSARRAAVAAMPATARAPRTATPLAPRARGALLAALVLLVGLLGASVDRAFASYTVHACDAAYGGGGAWAWTKTTWGSGAAYAGCPPGEGLTARHVVGAYWAPVGTIAEWSLTAPAGTTLGLLNAEISIDSEPAGWQGGVFDAQGRSLYCGALQACHTYTAWSPFSVNLGNTASVKLSSRCANVTGCSGDYVSAARLRNIAVRVDDNVRPSITSAGGSLWMSDAWLRGVQSVGFDATDAVGIERAYVELDPERSGGVLGSSLRVHPCDYTQIVPCPNGGTALDSFETATLADGTHTLRLAAVDTAGNQQLIDRLVRFDNHAPDEPADPVLSGGEIWSALGARTVSWVNPGGQAAPIHGAWVRTCRVGAANCRTEFVPGTGIASAPVTPFDGPGEYAIDVYLQDAAGNVNPANRSAPVRLRCDPTVPGRPVLAPRVGWLPAAAAGSFDQPVALSDVDRAALGPSGLAGYSVTTDGSEPDGRTIALRGERGLVHVSDLPEGVTTVRARAVSGAGVPSAAAGAAEIRVDRTPPSVSIGRVPDPATWQRAAVALTVLGADQAGLSGMAAAPAGEPIEHGGFVAYRIDGGPLQRTRGDRADVLVATDGVHTVSYQAFDAAGNASPERTANFRIDATAPERVVLERQDPGDPRTLAATVEDATSGVAGGVIELRRRGGDWRALETSLAGDRLSARVDDDALPAGSYDVRARVRDAAGNERIVGAFADGSSAVAGFRLATQLTAQLVGACPALAAPSKWAAPRVVPESCPRAAVTAGSTPPASFALAALTLNFGEAGRAEGRLVDSRGEPVAGAVLAVEERHDDTTTSGFRRVAELTSDDEGRYAYAVAPGPSRVLRFVFGGDQVRKGSSAAVTLRVTASTTLGASARRLRVGQTLTLSGALQTQGAAVPAVGKLIVLQAYDHGAWRQFATARTAADGSWRFGYRFVKSRGVVTYPFRAVVVREDAYAFEVGYSRTVRVTVRGSR